MHSQERIKKTLKTCRKQQAQRAINLKRAWNNFLDPNSPLIQHCHPCVRVQKMHACVFPSHKQETKRHKIHAGNPVNPPGIYSHPVPIQSRQSKNSFYQLEQKNSRIPPCGSTPARKSVLGWTHTRRQRPEAVKQKNVSFSFSAFICVFSAVESVQSAKAFCKHDIIKEKFGVCVL